MKVEIRDWEDEGRERGETAETPRQVPQFCGIPSNDGTWGDRRGNTAQADGARLEMLTPVTPETKGRANGGNSETNPNSGSGGTVRDGGRWLVTGMGGKAGGSGFREMGEKRQKSGKIWVVGPSRLGARKLLPSPAAGPILACLFSIPHHRCA